ncbi:MAG: PDZ domain-containing protein, partial [Anaerolineae bacterium]|nr:PDZ domain-containing protein [Anaerolineae bacterium]
PARLPAAAAESLGQETGALVVSVEHDSPAEKAGLYLGDTIVTLGSHKVEGMEDLLGALAATSIGATATLKIVRGGQVHNLSATVGERP